jgi:hypothetical protein
VPERVEGIFSIFSLLSLFSIFSIFSIFFASISRERVKRHPFWRYVFPLAISPKRYSGTRDGVH